MDCKYCNNQFIAKTSLIHHQKTAKYCLELQGQKLKLYVCESCNKDVSTKHRLLTHYQSCDKYKENMISNKYKKDVENLVLQLEEKDKIIEKQEKQIKELQDKLENIAVKAVSRPTSDFIEDASTIIIDEDYTIDDNKTSYYEEEYKLLPLEVGQGYTIEHREEDGFINVTNLCKAGGKQFKHWFSLDKTKDFLLVLSMSVGIPTDTLIKYIIVSKTERSTWAHPQVAINIAQWISPNFDVKVSAWVYEVMMTGKVDISNTKSYRQLQSENKDKELKIQYLTKKYVKRQPRVDYQERNVVYILTTSNMKKERRYILGKAENLTNRLSVYNKSDEHEVIYYESCGEIEDMDMAENMIFKKLKEYREQANRERFILPKEKDIEYFKDKIRECIKFIN